MATSASTFAAELTEALHAAASLCTVTEPDDSTCGRPGGRAEAICLFGHVELLTICPVCTTHRLYCSTCIEVGDGMVVVTIRTEVSA